MIADLLHIATAPLPKWEQVQFWLLAAMSIGGIAAAVLLGIAGF